MAKSEKQRKNIYFKVKNHRLPQVCLKYHQSYEPKTLICKEKIKCFLDKSFWGTCKKELLKVENFL
jgi:hypothetical protein